MDLLSDPMGFVVKFVNGHRTSESWIGCYWIIHVDIQMWLAYLHNLYELKGFFVSNKFLAKPLKKYVISISFYSFFFVWSGMTTTTTMIMVDMTGCHLYTIAYHIFLLAF